LISIPVRASTSQTDGHYGVKGVAREKTYGDVLDEYECHPESKCADATGAPSDKTTSGLLQRRHVLIRALKYIGKESNHLEDVENGVLHAAESVYTEYPDPRHDEWNTICERLKQVSLDEFERLTGKSRRMLIDARKGRRRTQARNRRLLAAVARKVGALK
jgi:hypothetical protein